jgi:hypothetical protein
MVGVVTASLATMSNRKTPMQARREVGINEKGWWHWKEVGQVRLAILMEVMVYSTREIWNREHQMTRGLVAVDCGGKNHKTWK